MIHVGNENNHRLSHKNQNDLSLQIHSDGNESVLITFEFLISIPRNHHHNNIIPKCT